MQNPMNQSMMKLHAIDMERCIVSGVFTNAELDSISVAIKFARGRLSVQTKRSLVIGDTVTFTSSKTGNNVTGTVQKIAVKFVTVRTLSHLWKVPANMLTRV
jgi:small-conductance mechanosensitive channel